MQVTKSYTWAKWQNQQWPRALTQGHVVDDDNIRQGREVGLEVHGWENCMNFF